MQEVSFCTLWPLTEGKQFVGTLVPMSLSSLLQKVEGKTGLWAVGDPLLSLWGGGGRKVPGGSQRDTHTAWRCHQCSALRPCFASTIHTRVHRERSHDRRLLRGTREEGFREPFTSSSSQGTASAQPGDLLETLSQHL